MEGRLRGGLASLAKIMRTFGGLNPSSLTICEAGKVLNKAFGKGREWKGTLQQMKEELYNRTLAFSSF